MKQLTVILLLLLVPVIFCNHEEWAIHIKAESKTTAHELAERHGHQLVGQIADLPNTFLFRKKPDTEHGVTHPHHSESSEIHWFEKQIPQKRYKRALPTDPLYSQQWHLHPVAAVANVHVNVEKAWEYNITGYGVTLAIVDDGIEYTHPDLAANYKASSSYDVNFEDPDPYPELPNDDHGTSAGGVAAARDNVYCGVGTAYRAGLAGIRLLSRETADVHEATALAYKNQENFIYSNSWGPMDDGKRKEGPGKLAADSLKNGVEFGRQGRGSIFVWAGGNGKRAGDNCNYDGWANSPYTVAIAAVDYQGQQAWYSEECSMLLVSAPSSGTRFSITSTDLRGGRGTSAGDCTSTFGGTSAAAPMAAGVIALILEANPKLTWREVQGVLIHSAARNDRQEPGWKINHAGMYFNHKYGFGLIDAYEGVQAAQSWIPYGERLHHFVTQNVSKAIPEGAFVTDTISISQITVPFILEHVQVTFEATHGRRGDLAIVLDHSGTESILAEKHGDRGRDYHWTFGSVVHWGESPMGDWTLKVRDEIAGETGVFTRWTLALYGHKRNGI